MKVTNGIQLYCKSMGKIYEVQHIAQSEEEANEFTAKHKATGVIAEDRKTGLIFIANLNSEHVSASVLPQY